MVRETRGARTSPKSPFSSRVLAGFSVGVAEPTVSVSEPWHGFLVVRSGDSDTRAAVLRGHGILAAALGDLGTVDDQIYQGADERQHNDQHHPGGLGPA